MRNAFATSSASFRRNSAKLLALRYLAIDLGDKRTGFALGDDITHIVSPIEVVSVPRHTDDARLLAETQRIIEAQNPGAIVIGLPLNMDDTEGPAAKSARDFGALLAMKTNLPIHFQDERLTSFAADQQLAGTGRTRKEKKGISDALAAAEILRDFLSSQSQD